MVREPAGDPVGATSPGVTLHPYGAGLYVKVQRVIGETRNAAPILRGDNGDEAASIALFPTLYRADQIDRAPDGMPIIFTPDELTADRLADVLDLTATTNPGGSCRPESATAKMLRPLHGRCVAILRNNDEAGREHAGKITDLLHRDVASLRVLDLPPEAFDRFGDWYEWLRNDGSAELLLALWRDAPEHLGHDIEPVRFFDLATAVKDGIPAPNWMLPGWFVHQDVAMLCGDPGAGKSTLAAGLAHALVHGTSWCGLDPVVPVRVLLVDEEQTAQQVARMYSRLGNPSPNLHFAIGQDVVIDCDEGANRLGRILDRLQFGRGLVIIDSVTQAFGAVPINDNDGVKLAMKRLKRLRDAHGCTFLLLHHKRKPGPFGGAQFNSYLGATALLSQSDAFMFYEVARDGDRDLTQTKRRDGELTSLKISLAIEGDHLELVGHGPVDANQAEIEKAKLAILDFLGQVPEAKRKTIVTEAATRAIGERTAARALADLKAAGEVIQPRDRGPYRIA